eukprot:1595693-Prymnesium_polylepis.3
MLAPPMTSKPTARKLTIKPLKTRPKLPENFEQDTWVKLQAAVAAVHTQVAVAHSLEELYGAVEDMCLQSLSANVYERLQVECERHIESRLSALVGQTSDTLAFLSLVDHCWSNHCNQMLTIRSIFLYLDRTYVKQARALTPSLTGPVRDAPSL